MATFELVISGVAAPALFAYGRQSLSKESRRPTAKSLHIIQ
jgi:hypothetical protein